MSRDSNGTYTLPAGTIVSFKQVPIPSASWNQAFNDLKTEMTDSLSRSGKGGMSADFNAGGYRVVGLSAGLVGTPGLQFTSDADTGMYSPAADQVGIACGGALAALFTAKGQSYAFTVISGNNDLTAGSRVAVRTNSAASQQNLPPTPDEGDWVEIKDADHNAATHNITIGRNGSTIEDLSEDLVLNGNGQFVRLMYVNASWRAV